MGTQVEWVRYGRAAAEALRSSIRAAKGDEPLTPVTVVVPSNHVGVATRRLLASGELGPVCGRGTGVVAVTFVTVYRLAELLGAPLLAHAGRRPVSTPVLAASMRAALAREPGMFATVAAHPATEQALVGAYRELRDLDDATLDRLGRASDRARDVVHLHRLARRRLERDWYDEQDLMAAAADAALPADLGAVIVYLPQRLSAPAASLLRSLPDVSVIAAVTGDDRADADVARSVERLGASPVRPAVVAGWVADAERTRFVTLSDADEEVRAAVRAVVGAVSAGTRLDRIAILHASPDPYARLAHEQLSAAGIEVNGSSVVPLSARMAGRTLLGALALHERGARRQDVMAWLTSAPIRHAGRWAPVNEWERLSREAAVVGGRADWDSRLERLAAELDASAVARDDDPDTAPGAGDRLRDRAAQARALRSFVLGLLDQLAGDAARPWGDHASWAADLLDRLLGRADQRVDWPASEIKAAERVQLALARLGALDGVEGPVPLDVFTRTLRLELDGDLGRIGRFGQGVLVGSVAMGVGLDLDLVVVLGLAEGSFPAVVRDDSLLPDSEREVAGGGLALRRQRVDREHRELLAALAGAARQVLCIPRGDLRRSTSSVPSRWAAELAGAIEAGAIEASGVDNGAIEAGAIGAGPAPDLLAAKRPWIEHVASFDAGLRALTIPATTQDHRLRTLLAGPDQLAGLAPLGLDVVQSRRSGSFTRFDGNLAVVAVPSPLATPTSATRLERWMRCPFSYFVQDILGVSPVENPEDQLRITPLDRGALVHRILERFILGVLAHEVPAPDQPWSAADHARLDAIAADECADVEAHGLTGRRIFWGRDRTLLVRDLHLALDRDSEWRAAMGTRPIAAELAFGLPGATTPAVGLQLEDGRTIRFRGKADRVDHADDGTLHVVDYKTGKVKDEKRLCEDDPVLGGSRLQLPVYGAAARLHAGEPAAPVVAEYWFVTSREDFRRHGIRITSEVLDHVGEVLGAIVEGIEGGVFPTHPTGESTSMFNPCWFCDPDYLGVTELRGYWERKRDDPALVAYADRVEPRELPVDA